MPHGPRNPEQSARPRPTLNVADAISITVGIVIGAGIFEVPALVAGNTGSASAMLGLWLLGGLISLLGALCFAELATAYPGPGGNYHYLKNAFGFAPAFLFLWGRFAVIQTGSIALLSFVIADYAAQIFSFGPATAPAYAVGAILLFTLINYIGIRQTTWTQHLLTASSVLGMGALILSGMFFGGSAPASAAITHGNMQVGLALVFVLLAFGGWGEAAFISAELKDRRRNIPRALVVSIVLITVLYFALNYALYNVLGLAGMANSQAVAAQMTRQVWGEGGAQLLSMLVVICALDSLNATILTGARSNYALAEDTRTFNFLAGWTDRAATPRRALIAQCVVALLLVAYASYTREGFKSMVEYTAPVYWFFYLLTGISLFVLRRRAPDEPDPYRVPLYPLVPLGFCAASAYLVYSSLAYAGRNAWIGGAVLLAGVPFLLYARGRSSSSPIGVPSKEVA